MCLPDNPFRWPTKATVQRLITALLVSGSFSASIYAQIAADPSKAPQIASEKLRELTKKIRMCPESDERSSDGSGYRFEEPLNVVWKIEAAEYSGSQQIGVVEFVQHQIYVARPLEQCKKRDSDCQVRNLNTKQFNVIMFGVNMPDQFRLEFEISPEGIELARSLAKRQSDDQKQWVADKPHAGCIAESITSVTIKL